MKAITVCVDYAPLLAMTMPRNLPHLDQWLIVTSPDDGATRDLVECYRACGERVSLYSTDAFYRRGALFNKGLAIEEAFDALGRDGWIMVLDADIVLPEDISLPGERQDCLYSPFRRICRSPKTWNAARAFATYPRHPDREFAGYCQVFHAESGALRGREVWYGTDWTHAGGCDSDFQALWPDDWKIRPEWEVLHLGEPQANWAGVDPRKRDQLRGLLAKRRGKDKYRHEKIQRP